MIGVKPLERLRGDHLRPPDAPIDDPEPQPQPEPRRRLRRPGRAWLVLGSLTPVAVIAALASIAARQPDDQFLFQQQSPPKVERPAVETLVLKAPEPVASGPKPKATKATCRSGSRTDRFGNPWTCRITYASKHTLTYRVTVRHDGSIRGVDRTGTGFLTGCCVRVPTIG
jgi:hypothetical protein